MRQLRKWSRILHRDIGFFFIGASIIYGLSGIALNHLKDWNPNYFVSVKEFVTELDLRKSPTVKNNVIKLIDDIDKWMEYHETRNETSHTYDEDIAEDVFETAREFIVDAETLLKALEDRND